MGNAAGTAGKKWAGSIRHKPPASKPEKKEPEQK
jgi:hypothetical protein